MVSGWLRKAENKAEAQYSWGLGLAELGKKMQKIVKLRAKFPDIFRQLSEKVSLVKNIQWCVQKNFKIISEWLCLNINNK